MMLIELFAPHDPTGGRRNRRLAERLLDSMTVTQDDAPPEAVEAGRALWHVMVHEPAVWLAGGRQVEPTDAPSYFVRVSAPGPLPDEAREHYVSAVTQVLADEDEDPGRFYREPKVCVHIVELPGGSFGALGRTMQQTDIVKLIMGSVPAQPARPVRPGADTATDPICGMTVDLTGDPATLDHDGATYAFCSPACRTIFAEQHA